MAACFDNSSSGHGIRIVVAVVPYATPLGGGNTSITYLVEASLPQGSVPHLAERTFLQQSRYKGKSV